MLMMACSVSPLRLLALERQTPQPPIALGRCGERQDVLCLVTFGLEPPDEMLIVLAAAPDLPQGLEVEVQHKGSTLQYLCESTEQTPGTVYCTGPQLPLGSTMLVQVYATKERYLVASGEFVLMALALPTVPVGGTAPATPWFLVPGSGQTPTPSLTLRAATPTRSATRLPPSPTMPVPATRTPPSGTAYPNPNP